MASTTPNAVFKIPRFFISRLLEFPFSKSGGNGGGLSAVQRGNHTGKFVFRLHGRQSIDPPHDETGIAGPLLRACPFARPLTQF
jgi:hypothetical protein